MENGDHTPLRDRRRAQTEQEIGEVALALFEKQGIDHTTVDEIARLSGVSPRTFFRYFATKERAALVPHRDLEDRVEQMISTMRADRPLLGQLEEIWVEVLTAFDDADSEPGRQLLRVRRLMRTEPTLRMAAASLDAERADELVARVTRLMGFTDELAARVLTETAAVPVRIALDVWAESIEAGRPADLIEIHRRCRTLMGEALARSTTTALS
ncbi:TetR family transcriptional regulator [Kineosporia succinea]|uniref:AcrR family transcriptional regulator n=1 Tax=Kineosporia succinea TaxID=84632 RepID=A0ABT9NVI0_9ACTN|nr:TetR family transcriptional regulator [Kineosporia succinea]MDP9824427.1 AcrR family transcriptional regulator [Kineosporia succinea]